MKNPVQGLGGGTGQKNIMALFGEETLGRGDQSDKVD